MEQGWISTRFGGTSVRHSHIFGFGEGERTVFAGVMTADYAAREAREDPGLIDV